MTVLSIRSFDGFHQVKLSVELCVRVGFLTYHKTDMFRKYECTSRIRNALLCLCKQIIC